MKSSPTPSQKCFGGLFAAMLGLLSISAAHAQIFYDTGSEQTVVLAPGTYDITTYGAQGGALPSQPSPGGLGAEMSGEFTFATSTTLTILVGGTGSASAGGGGGGGGSFVVLTAGMDYTPLVIAGGGGGGGQFGDGSPGLTGTNGGPGGGGAGGTGGNGGSSYGGGGGSGAGGGYSGSAITYMYNSGGGSSFIAGGTGGSGAEAGGGNGGYGGGGGGGGQSGGGGGGYSGGASGGNNTTGVIGGGGGGSYYNALYLAPDTSITATAGVRSGNGEVLIEDLSETPEPSTWALLLGGLGLLAFWHRRTRRAAIC
jgi:hypothetical protein